MRLIKEEITKKKKEILNKLESFKINKNACWVDTVLIFFFINSVAVYKTLID